MVRSILALAGLLLLLGSAGALEQDLITFGRFAVQAGIGLILIAQAVLRRHRA